MGLSRSSCRTITLHKRVVHSLLLLCDQFVRCAELHVPAFSPAHPALRVFFLGQARLSSSRQVRLRLQAADAAADKSPREWAILGWPQVAD